MKYHLKTNTKCRTVKERDDYFPRGWFSNKKNDPYFLTVSQLKTKYKKKPLSMIRTTCAFCVKEILG